VGFRSELARAQPSGLDLALASFSTCHRLLAPDGRNYAPAAALVARGGPERQTTSNRASAVTGRAGMKIAMSGRWWNFLGAGCRLEGFRARATRTCRGFPQWPNRGRLAGHALASRYAATDIRRDATDGSFALALVPELSRPPQRSHSTGTSHHLLGRGCLRRHSHRIGTMQALRQHEAPTFCPCSHDITLAFHVQAQAASRRAASCYSPPRRCTIPTAEQAGGVRCAAKLDDA